MRSPVSLKQFLAGQELVHQIAQVEAIGLDGRDAAGCTIVRLIEILFKSATRVVPLAKIVDLLRIFLAHWPFVMGQSGRSG